MIVRTTLEQRGPITKEEIQKLHQTEKIPAVFDDDSPMLTEDDLRRFKKISEENKEANQIPDGDFEMMIGNIIDDREIQDAAGYEKYDIVTANILADVLVPLTPVIVQHMKKGGTYITSGILDVKESVVVEAVKKAGLEVLEVTHQGEWVSVTARKN